MSGDCTSSSPPVLTHLPKKPSVSFSSYRKCSRPLQVFRTSRHPFLGNWIVGFNLIWKSIWEGDFHSLCSLALEAKPARPRTLADLNVINSKQKKAGVRWCDGSGRDWRLRDRWERVDRREWLICLHLSSFYLSLTLVRPAGAAVK